jgi:hypothetical protein
VFIERYRVFYKHACDLLKNFNSDTGLSYSRVTLEEFQARVMHGEKMQDIPSDTEKYEYAAFLLPKILVETTDIKIMRRVTEWLTLKTGG